MGKLDLRREKSNKKLCCRGAHLQQSPEANTYFNMCYLVVNGFQEQEERLQVISGLMPQSGTSLKGALRDCLKPLLQLHHSSTPTSSHCCNIPITLVLFLGTLLIYQILEPISLGTQLLLLVLLRDQNLKWNFELDYQQLVQKWGAYHWPKVENHSH